MCSVLDLRPKTFASSVVWHWKEGRLSCLTAATTSLASIAKLRAASPVVDKPVADLRHADAGRLSSSQSQTRLAMTDDTYAGEDGFLFLARIWVGDILHDQLVND